MGSFLFIVLESSPTLSVCIFRLFIIVDADGGVLEIYLASPVVDDVCLMGWILENLSIPNRYKSYSFFRMIEIIGTHDHMTHMTLVFPN